MLSLNDSILVKLIIIINIIIITIIIIYYDQEPVWVDTVGWDDAEIGDDQTFREILTFIDK